MLLLHKQSVQGTFPWNGTDYTTTQAGTRIAKMAADHILNLTVTPKPACCYYINNLFWGISWNGTRLTTQEAGKIAKDGCTADQVLNLTVTQTSGCCYYANNLF
jgi:hypothetical protein